MMTLADELEGAARALEIYAHRVECDGWPRAVNLLRHAAERERKKKARKGKPQNKPKPRKLAVFVGGKAKPGNAFKLDASKIEGAK